MKFWPVLAMAAFLAVQIRAQNLPDAPSAAQKPTAFGGANAGLARPSAAVMLPENEALSHVLTRPIQVYPAQASVSKIEGDVVLQVEIDTTGNVESLKLVSGSPLLAPAAAAYVKQWIFRPFYEGETRVPIVTRLTVRYSLFANQAERDLQKHFQATYWPAWQAGEAALAQQDYATAKAQFETARAEAAKLPEADWPELANALSRLGAVEYRQKNYAAAEPYLVQALQQQQNHRDPDAPEIADAQGNLAELYMAENEYGKAEPLLLKAVDTYESNLQPSARKVPLAVVKGWWRHRVLDLFMLGSLNQEMGAHDDATHYCDLAVADAPKALAKDEAVVVLRTCETVYRKNLKLNKAHDAEQLAGALEK